MKKIPDNATKVFEGVIFDVYQWQQEMFDGTFSTFEALRKRNSVTVIAVVGDKVIINEEEQPAQVPFLALPGGMCEKGVLPLEDTTRELLEETGYSTDDWQEWFVSDPLKYGRMEWNNHYFIARHCKKTDEQKLDSGEKIKVTLVSFEEFLEFRHNPKSRNKDLFPILEKAATDEGEKQKLKDLLGITT
jgi:ADP-ribose pyrophosphatase